MTATRKQVRKGFAALLETALDEMVAATYDHYRRDLGGASPVAVVVSAGKNAQGLTPRGGRESFFIDVFFFVLRGRNEEYTDADADDVLDDLEALLTGVVLGNRVVSGLWQSVAFRDESLVETRSIGGEQYLMERHPLQFEVY